MLLTIKHEKYIFDIILKCHSFYSESGPDCNINEPPVF